jgi:MoaA/NifB/PqqE/SkfB family radical SAM enzyme
MPVSQPALQRKWAAISRRFRELGLIARGLLSTDHVVQAHIIPMRRCNLDCGYCNEYDDFSPPVPLEEMKRRIGHLGRLGASLITISGGEPLMHPDIEEIIREIRRQGALAGMITNGLLLTPDKIQKLNEAGLDHLQISIDNVVQDEVSKKSLRVLDKKLVNLSQHALFHVNINSVVGGGIKNPEDAHTVATRALELGLSSTVGIIHDGQGQLKSLPPTVYDVFQRVRALSKRSYARFNHFQESLAQGKPNNWRCRAGARYLYICEEGLVHYCSQQRGYPGRPIADYTAEDLRREYLTEKGCAPACTISCVHQTSLMDFWRDPQTIPAVRLEERAEPLVQIQSASR